MARAWFLDVWVMEVANDLNDGTREHNLQKGARSFHGWSLCRLHQPIHMYREFGNVRESFQPFFEVVEVRDEARDSLVEQLRFMDKLSAFLVRSSLHTAN